MAFKRLGMSVIVLFQIASLCFYGILANSIERPTEKSSGGNGAVLATLKPDTLGFSLDGVPSDPPPSTILGLVAGSETKTQASGSVEEDGDICLQEPLMKGLNRQCLAFLIRYTFNSTVGKCVPYIYGGCGKSSNVFETLESCKEACPDRESSTESQGNLERSALRESSVESVEASAESRQTRSDRACEQSLEAGPCFGFFRKWGFNKDTGRCEWFIYGGCRGNDNQFDTARSCQDTCGGSEPLTDVNCDTKQCPWNLWGHYLAKQCVPVYERGECCPTRFDCPDEPNDSAGTTGQCTYEGVTYPVGSKIPAVTELEPCKVLCECQSVSQYPGVTRINCVNVECPEDLGSAGRGCRRVYNSSNQCCASTFVCGDAVQGALEAEDKVKCEVDGREYLEGEKIYINDPSVTCICNQTFLTEGATSKHACTPIKCGWESVYHDRLQRGCTPVYYGTRACPIDWVCPGDRGQKVDTLPDSDISARKDDESARHRPERVDAAPVASEATTPGANPSQNNVCLTPKSHGPCDALIPKFYYNAITGKCESFNYGGCGGNENKFDTMKECETACGGSPDGCSLSPEVGKCRARKQAWFFNSTFGECEKFIYGGCNGNQNNFANQDSCESSCKRTGRSAQPTYDDPISLPPEQSGTTSFHDLMAQDNSEEEGTTSSSTTQPAQTEEDEETPDETLAEACKMPMNRGSCYGRIPRFFHNATSGKCDKFFYGGCLGNENNFRKLEDCLEKCGVTQQLELKEKSPTTNTQLKPVSPVLHNSISDNIDAQPPSNTNEEDPCSLPAKRGMCRARFPRFFFNSESKQCESFIYGGCHGNENNFKTLQECQDKCAPGVVRAEAAIKQGRCYLPEAKGDCKASLKMFLFDVEQDRCRSFNYTGCRGNRNRFQTMGDCEAACGGPHNPQIVVDPKPAMKVGRARGGVGARARARGSVVNGASMEVKKKEQQIEPCFQPKVTGPCRMFYTQYHYDTREGKCKEFRFGGCMGNSNRFPSMEACSNACEKRLLEVKDNRGMPLECNLGSDKFRLGSGFLPESNKCYQCSCSTPPGLTCQNLQAKCPASPGPNYVPKYTADKCCPDYELAQE